MGSSLPHLVGGTADIEDGLERAMELRLVQNGAEPIGAGVGVRLEQTTAIPVRETEGRFFRKHSQQNTDNDSHVFDEDKRDVFLQWV